jgi:hypothetical protein
MAGTAAYASIFLTPFFQGRRIQQYGTELPNSIKLKTSECKIMFKPESKHIQEISVI